MSNFKSTYATDNRVESTVHIISHYLRAATNKLGAKKADTDYFVMTGKLVEDLINYYQNRDAKSALVVDDVGLQVINRLIQEGIKDITLALARVPEENLETVKYIIHNTFPEFNIKIISIEEIEGMKPDLVIANPPYGIPGANITKKIIDTVDFKEYVNLLPANDYLKSKDIYNYVLSIKNVPGFGDDAHVLPVICKLSNTKIHSKTIDEAYIMFSSNENTYKFFNENYNRNDVVEFIEDTTNPNTDFSDKMIFGVKISANANNHSDGCKIQGSKNAIIWDINNKIRTLRDHYEKRKSKALWGTIIKFNNSRDRDNAFNFIYSDAGARFCNMLVTSMNKDNFNVREHRFWFPKVDWSRAWTVEEILVDYGYTEEEIKKVMEDLKNYKGMED